MIKIYDLAVPLDYDDPLLINLAAKKLRIDPSEITDIKMLKRSVDRKDKSDVHFNITASVSISRDESKLIEYRRNTSIQPYEDYEYVISHKLLKKRPVIAGCGPAGLFCALILAEAGTKPILFERGLDIAERKKRVERFMNSGILDTETNVQFGEGGAGTFSDGKLKTGMMDARKLKILNEFVNAGAPSEILWQGMPHIGTDNLYHVVKNIRNKIISLGGEVHFSSKVTDIFYSKGHVTGLGFVKDGIYNEMSCDNLVLAIGHSARDTFKKLFASGIQMRQKNFAVGVRIEHPQSLINELEYGSFKDHPKLGAADYRMVVHLPNGRSVYTFCMCPGGTVVASTSSEHSIVTNGMSMFSRDGENANTALLVSVGSKDLKTSNPLEGFEYLAHIEHAGFRAGGSNYNAPAQLLKDFMYDVPSTALGSVKPTYKPGVTLSELKNFLPSYITDSLREGIKNMELWKPGYYYSDAVLTGPETRTTSPVEIPRTESLEALGISGLYPCGEGAGYAGGIVSAAVDGIKCAEAILKTVD